MKAMELRAGHVPVKAMSLAEKGIGIGQYLSQAIGQSLALIFGNAGTDSHRLMRLGGTIFKCHDMAP